MTTETRLGSYEVKEFLSDIGLDDLYLAFDTRTEREVVVRAVPVFVDEAAAMDRMRLRARDIEALGDDALLAFPTVEKTDGMVLAVADRPAGCALDHYIRGQKLSLPYVFEIAGGLVRALEALHAAGHVHGNLHPGRVVIAGDRQVHVMTIGPEEAERTPSLRAALCRAPEVRNGTGPDQRAEVFALGALLYEIATGAPPFRGDTAQEALESVNDDLPAPITDLRPELPQELARIVARCLKKDPSLRCASVQEVRADLEELEEGLREGRVSLGRRESGVASTESDESSTEPQRPAAVYEERAWWSDWRVGAVAASALVIGAVVGALMFAGGAETAGETVPRWVQATATAGPELYPSLSGDGRQMVYAAAEGGDWDIYAREVAGGEAVALTADSPADDYQPVLSADGLRIAFRSDRDGGGIFVMDRDGGAVTRVTDFGYNPSWSPDRTELLISDASVTVMPRLDGNASAITAVALQGGARRIVVSGDARQPAWSPNEDRVAYWSARAGGGSDIWTVPASGGEPVALTDDPATDWNPVWAPDGSYLYFTSDRSGSADLWRMAVDEGSGEARGPAEPVASGGSVQAVHPSFARDEGTMAFVEARVVHDLYRIPFDPGAGTVTGRAEALGVARRSVSMLEVSPDGRKVAFVAREGDEEDVYVSNLDGTERVRITEGASRNRFPRWSPDGRSLAFLSDRAGFFQVWMAPSGGGPSRQVTELRTRRLSYPVWSPDGRSIGVTAGGEMTPSYTMLFDPDVAFADQFAETLYTTPSERTFEPTSWSRGGSRIAGNVRLRNGAVGGIAVMTVGSDDYEEITSFGVHPQWLRDGRRLLYQAGNWLFLVDSRSPRPTPVFVSTPDVLADGFSLSADNRWIYVSLERTEADAWLRR